MNKTTKLALIALLGAMTALYGCDGDDDPDGGTDSGTADTGTPPVDSGPTDSGPDDAGPVDAGPVADCAAYCSTATANCDGEAFWYDDNADCMAICTGFAWPAGAPVTVAGPLDGNTIGCRTYHGGAPAAETAATHCPHASYTGGDVCGTRCENYCTAAMNVCTGANALYADMGECMTACEPLDDTADIGVTDGDTVQCRMYHLSVAVLEADPDTHCAHAAADGGGVCVGGWTFLDDAPTAYTRVDHAGMPAVPTVLAGTLTQAADGPGLATTRAAYNDAAPNTGGFIPGPNGVGANLTALHTALSDDLIGVTTCATYSTAPADADTEGVVAAAPAGLATCVAQAAPLVIPDVISVDRAGGAIVAFPNGRQLTDPVIDMTLAVILLDLSVEGQDVNTLVGTNPTANDVAFSSDFPYLAVPHTP